MNWDDLPFEYPKRLERTYEPPTLVLNQTQIQTWARALNVPEADLGTVLGVKIEKVDETWHETETPHNQDTAPRTPTQPPVIGHRTPFTKSAAPPKQPTTTPPLTRKGWRGWHDSPFLSPTTLFRTAKKKKGSRATRATPRRQTLAKP